MNPYDKAVKIITDFLLKRSDCSEDEAKELAEDLICEIELNNFFIEYNWESEGK